MKKWQKNDLFFSNIDLFCFSLRLGILFWQKNNIIITIQLGLSVIPVLGTLLNILHIPLHWRIFLTLALIARAYQFTQ